MNVLALDLSLTSTGVALPSGLTERWITRPTAEMAARLDRVATEVERLVRHVDLAVIEDLPFHARAAGQVGLVHGAVRLVLWREQVRTVMVTAASLKKYATGKGNSNKDAMGIAAMRRADLDFSGRPDECDAWWLRAMALDHYGAPVVQLPKAQRDALAKVAWPAIEDLPLSAQEALTI